MNRKAFATVLTSCLMWRNSDIFLRSLTVVVEHPSTIKPSFHLGTLSTTRVAYFDREQIVQISQFNTSLSTELLNFTFERIKSMTHSYSNIALYFELQIR